MPHADPRKFDSSCAPYLRVSISLFDTGINYILITRFNLNSRIIFLCVSKNSPCIYIYMLYTVYIPERLEVDVLVIRYT